MARPKSKDLAGSILGGIIGGLLAGPAGIALGGLLGTAANSETPLPLEVALAAALKERGFDFAQLVRTTKHSITLVFSTAPGQFWSIDVSVKPRGSWTPDDLDDALYDTALKKLMGFRGR